MSQFPNFDQSTRDLSYGSIELINLLIKNQQNLIFNGKKLYYIRFCDQNFYFREGTPTFGSTVVLTLPVHSDWNCSCMRCRTHTGIQEVEKIHHVYLTKCSETEHKYAIHSKEMENTANKAANILVIELPMITRRDTPVAPIAL